MVKRKVRQKTATTFDEVQEDGPAGVWKFFLAFGIIMVVLIGYYAYSQYRQQSVREENQYNGFDFTRVEGDLWVTRIEIGRQPYDIPFYYHPAETTDIFVDRTAADPLLGDSPQEVYISLDPDAGSKVVIAGVEISRITGSRYELLNYPTRAALSRPAIDSRTDFPIISCKDATPDRVVIQFVLGKQNAIGRSSKNPQCIILQYTDANESIRVADRYAYMLLKIMS